MSGAVQVEIRCQFCNAVLSSEDGNWEGEHKAWCPVIQPAQVPA